MRNEYDREVFIDVVEKHQYRSEDAACSCGLWDNNFVHGDTYGRHLTFMYQETPFFLRQRAINDSERDGFPDGEP